MIGAKLGVEDIGNQIEGKKIFLRADFNVPIKDGRVTDSFRIKSTIPTIDYLFAKGAKCVICASHCGRPDGKPNAKYSLQQIQPELQRLSGRNVTFVPDCVGPVAEEACNQAETGSLILLENLRFHPEEEGSYVDEAGKKVKASQEKVREFREGLSKLGDIYVNDAFGTAHRAHASMVGVDKPIRVAGRLMKKELEYFSKALENPKKPFLAICGGAKISDKLPLLKNFATKADNIYIGGGMVFTILKERENMKIGSSLYDAEGPKVIKELYELLAQTNAKIILPVDFVAAKEFKEDAEHKLVSKAEGIPDGWMGLDIGPESQAQLRKAIEEANTILVNGPPGVFEMPAFSAGSKALVEALDKATKRGAVTICGGGDTAAMIEKFGDDKSVSHLSTGGGAALELMEGKELPGVSYLIESLV